MDLTKVKILNILAGQLLKFAAILARQLLKFAAILVGQLIKFAAMLGKSSLFDCLEKSEPHEMPRLPIIQYPIRRGNLRNYVHFAIAKRVTLFCPFGVVRH